jgi:hypothetical protein
VDTAIAYVALVNVLLVFLGVFVVSAVTKIPPGHEDLKR